MTVSRASPTACGGSSAGSSDTTAGSTVLTLDHCGERVQIAIGEVHGVRAAVTRDGPGDRPHVRFLGR